MEKEAKEKENIIKKINNSVTGDVIVNLTFASMLIIYFIFFNIFYNKLETSILLIYEKVASFVLLVTSIITFEVAYKKDDDKTALYGIEFLVVSIFSLLAEHLPKVLNIDVQKYILAGTFSIAIYYALKVAIMYTKEKKKELASLSDIKEIVKEEPLKKQTKRKNKKEEE